MESCGLEARGGGERRWTSTQSLVRPTSDRSHLARRNSGGDARAYRESLRADLREVRSVDANVGAFVLAHRVMAKRSSCFVFLWESMDAVLGFAGPDVDRG